MHNGIFWGAIQRFGESTAQAALFVLTGLIITGVFRHVLGHQGLKRLFGSGTWRSLPQAWLLGMLLPVCSLGVIPIMREMKRAGLKTGTILAFGLTAPLFNPLSVLYGLTLSEPTTIMAFALASLFVVTVIGLVFDRLFPVAQAEATDSVSSPFGIKRVIAVFDTTSRELFTWSGVYILFGLLGVSALSMALPHASFQHQVNGDNPLAPVLMTGVAVPAYATPMLAMSQLGVMFQHGNSVGAAFALLILGAGMNLGIIAWMYSAYGWKISSSWMAMLLVVVLGLGYGLESPLYPTDIDPADHTHAFDVYCCPFIPETTDHVPKVVKSLSEDLKIEEKFSFFALLALCSVGIVLVLVEKNTAYREWLQSHPESSTDATGKYDMIVPDSVLGGVALAGLMLLSLTGCYAYYAVVDECLEEIFIIKGEVLSAANSGDEKHALHWIPIWEDWNRRLQVGVYLRHWELSEYHRMKALLVQEKLEALEHALEDQDRDNIRRLVTQLGNAQLRLSKAYRKLEPPQE